MLRINGITGKKEENVNRTGMKDYRYKKGGEYKLVRYMLMSVQYLVAVYLQHWLFENGKQDNYYQTKCGYERIQWLNHTQ